ncbi:MAG: ABC transporter permease [endosymbiont of Galathealinum brachiosum]|uniref:ABC transporter permease n=1 Tax=endosymbiont of Galathealinum brachiosum TaxID=2200906 RepID=A0A370DLS8_9GAMM|nr:MAG: ABC transporter permease [endosymbiont of Galathealinum brachiosum]
MLIIKLALRNILRNRRRSLLTILSMGGGYFMLSFMLSMTEGSYSNMIDLFTRDHTGHVQVHKGNYLDRPSLFKTINQTTSLIESIKNNPQVIGVTARIYGPSLAYGKNKTFPANVIGINPELESETTFLKEKVNQGQYLTSGVTSNGYFPAMLGKSLAKNLHLEIGDELVLISQGVDGSIANDVFEVVAIVGTAESFERMNVYLSMDGMRQFLSMGDQVHELAISLNHQSLARDFSKKLQQILQQNDLQVKPWQKVEEVFYKSMQADLKGNYISMGIIIFIVSIGVLNTVLMGTLERTREFGVLKAVGTRPATIFKLIMLESFFLSMISCLLGLVFALPANYWLSVVGITMPEPIDMGGVLFESMLGEISWFSMGVPALVVVSSTLLVSLIPAVRAARISPLQALQAV